NRHLWNDERQAYVDCIHEDGTPSTIFSQQTQTIAYLCDIVPPERRELFERYLKDVPKDWVKIGSPFMMAFTLEVLERAGDIDSVVKLIRRWWGMMIQTDATACWETFHNALGSTWPTRSYCHAWSAAPAYALPAYVLGVQPIEPGFAKFSLRPHLGDLEFARGAVPTPHGDILIDMCRTQEGVTIDLTVPTGTVAVMRDVEYGPGNHRF
ncbi:MAG: alpha-L-rhamnosidase C-terminal domain-containing protein, partial [Armatimonadota bacterium]